MNSNTIQENWAEVCERIKSYESCDISQLNAFFSRIEPQAMSEGFLMLTTDNDFLKGWIETHYVDLVKRALEDIYHVPFTVIVEVNVPPAQPAADTQQSYPAPTPPSAADVPLQETVGGSPYAPAVATQVPEAQGGLPTATYTPHEHPGTAAQGAPYGDPVAATVAPRGTYHAPQAHPQLNSSLDTSFDHYVETAPSQMPPMETSAEEDKPASSLTFENFVIGESNRMAYSMAVSVAERPGRTPLNPLFIYGKSGLGKTHLMRAIQNYIRTTQPEVRTVYVDSAELLSDYMEASAAHDKEKSSYKNFKTHYEQADVLLIDDIQYLQGKKQTLDIVFQIFNKLTDEGRQVVLSADRAPKNIDIDERYHSRFNQGGTIDIQPPEIETKLGIVKSFIGEYLSYEGLESLSIPEDVQMYIAENSSSNIRELKSAVTKVIYQVTFFNQSDITINDVRILLENHFSGGNSKNLTVEDIQGETEKFYKVKHSDLIGPKRSRNIIYPRQIAMYLCRELLDLPFANIGEKFNRDHSSVLHSCTRVEDYMKSNRDVQEEVETLKQIIREL